MDKETYTIAEAMPIFGVGKTTITHWINIGLVDAEKVKGKWIIEGDSLREWKKWQELGIVAASKEMGRRFELAMEKHKAIRHQEGF